MTPGTRFAVMGTAADVDGFVRSLEYEPDLEVVHTETRAQPPEADERFGEVELVEVLISIATSAGGRAVYELVKGAFDRYAAKRPHMRISAPEDTDALEAEPSQEDEKRT